MSKYLAWDQKTITSFNDDTINTAYNSGYVFTRLGKGIMHQTRSVRIDLSQFELNSENRRILHKTKDLKLEIEDIPYKDYSWEIGKMAKDFYGAKFGAGTFSANKIKNLMNNSQKSNFNKLLKYSSELQTPNYIVGYAICHETKKFLHYSYPFYSRPAFVPILVEISANTGLGMMLKAILYAQEHGKKYIYLGSAQRPTDTYKLQFKGLEWFDGKKWKDDIEKLKTILHL